MLTYRPSRLLGRKYDERKDNANSLEAWGKCYKRTEIKALQHISPKASEKRQRICWAASRLLSMHFPPIFLAPALQAHYPPYFSWHSFLSLGKNNKRIMLRPEGAGSEEDRKGLKLEPKGGTKGIKTKRNAALSVSWRLQSLFDS